jgi:hypothetical protein
MAKLTKMGLLKYPVILAWLVASFVLMIISILMGIFMPNETVVIVAAALLSQASGSIFFPILVGYFYDRLKEKESGEAIWQVFKEFSDGGIIRIYKDREESPYPENAVSSLRQAFANHTHGEVKLVGVSLRVFFNPTGPFYDVIRNVASVADTNPNIRMKALICNPGSPEVANRNSIENPQTKDSLIERDIRLTAANIKVLQTRFPRASVEYGLYNEAPYCTLIIFPDRCFYSPNILSKEAPVRLPLIVFRSGSHGYRVLNEYFEWLWNKRVGSKNPTIS